MKTGMIDHTAHLFQKNAVEKLTNTIIDIDDIDLSLRAIQDGLKMLNENEQSRLWLNGERLSAPGLCGMVNCIRKEGNENCIKSIYNESEEPINEAVLSQIMKYDLAMSVYRNSQWGSFRYLDMPKNELSLNGNAHVNVTSVGDLSSLGWMSSPDDSHAQETYDAYYCAINFKDVMLATGKLSASAFGGTLANSMESWALSTGRFQQKFKSLNRSPHMSGISRISGLWSRLQLYPLFI